MVEAGVRKHDDVEAPSCGSGFRSSCKILLSGSKVKVAGLEVGGHD